MIFVVGRDCRLHGTVADVGAVLGRGLAWVSEGQQERKAVQLARGSRAGAWCNWAPGCLDEGLCRLCSKERP